MTFGKPGRPPEDRLLRQREIYEAVAPLILSEGARRLQMRDAAHAAYLSVGGLYYYFPNKRELVLHGLNPEARRRICEEAIERASRMEGASFAKICADTCLRVIAFMRPSVIAARDLGGETLQATLDPDWTSDVDELVEHLQPLLPDAPAGTLETLARLMRRVMIGALTEREVDLEVVTADLRQMIEAHVNVTSSQRMT